MKKALNIILLIAAFVNLGLWGMCVGFERGNEVREPFEILHADPYDLLAENYFFVFIILGISYLGRFITKQALSHIFSMLVLLAAILPYRNIYLQKSLSLDKPEPISKYLQFMSDTITWDVISVGLTLTLVVMHLWLAVAAILREQRAVK